MYKFFYALSPKKYKNWIEKHIQYCDFTVSAQKLIGFIILFGLFLGFTVGFLFFVLKFLSFELSILATAVSATTFFVIAHLLLILIADSRANFVELILPDALQIISANMRSGLTPDKAILTSARPEFGPLEIELKKVAKETLSGRPFEESLRKVSAKIKSRILEKTISLLVEGLAKGGSITTLLDSIADDIRQVRILRGEIKSYVMMYGIFIFFAVSIGAPLLYSVSTYMVQTLTQVGGLVKIEEFLATPTPLPFFKFRVSQITPEFVSLYSTMAIFLTSIFGGLLIGLVQEGSEKAGLKFIPIILVIGLAVYFLSQNILRNVFGILIL